MHRVPVQLDGREIFRVTAQSGVGVELANRTVFVRGETGKQAPGSMVH